MHWVIQQSIFNNVWRRDAAKSHPQEMEVIVSPLKEIYREYRLFVVKGKVVTGSVYKVGGRLNFNNINSSGFYACDVAKYVDAIQTRYA